MLRRRLVAIAISGVIPRLLDRPRTSSPPVHLRVGAVATRNATTTTTATSRCIIGGGSIDNGGGAGSHRALCDFLGPADGHVDKISLIRIVGLVDHVLDRVMDAVQLRGERLDSILLLILCIICQSWRSNKERISCGEASVQNYTGK